MDFQLNQGNPITFQLEDNETTLQLGGNLKSLSDLNDLKIENIQDNESSVKMLETVCESLITSMKQSMETQLFTLRNQKTEINRSDRGKIEKRREIDEIQEEIEGIEDQLENLERVREEVLD